jgi:SNF2 family DNA or RNA helicase
VKPSKREKWRPHRYQQKAVKFGVELGAAGLFLKPGLGKTTISYAIMKLLRKAGLMVRALVIAPLRPAYQVWPAEADKWEDFADFNVVVLHGSKKEKLLRGIIDGTVPCDVVVINPEGLDWLFDVTKTKNRRGKTEVRVDLTKFRRLQCNVLFVDEASKFKKSSSQRFQVMKLVLDDFDRRYVLTGSPTPNGLMDLFGIVYLIDQGEALGQYITHYRNAYFNSTGYGGYTYVLQDGAERRIQQAIKPVVLAMGDEMLDLPQLVSVPVLVELPEDVRAFYDEVEEEFFATWDGGSFVASNAGAALTKCAQIANGGIYLNQQVDDEGVRVGRREWKNLHTAKTDAARDYVEDLLGAQVLITYDFEHDLDRLTREFGKLPRIGKGVTPKMSKQYEDDWNAGLITEMLVHPAAAAHGLNLQGSSAQHIFMHSLTFNYEEYDQLIRRIRRQGSKAQRIYVAHCIAKGTVDEVKMVTLNKKRAGETSFMSEMASYRARKRATR